MIRNQIDEDFHPDDWPIPRELDSYSKEELFFLGLNEARMMKYCGMGGEKESNYSKTEWKFILECRKIGLKFFKRQITFKN